MTGRGVENEKRKETTMTKDALRSVSVSPRFAAVLRHPDSYPVLGALVSAGPMVVEFCEPF
jgi:hypothetical protein